MVSSRWQTLVSRSLSTAVVVPRREIFFLRAREVAGSLDRRYSRKVVTRW